MSAPEIPSWFPRALAAWFEAHPELWRFVRFLFVGGLNAMFGYALFAGLLFIGLHYALAGLLATVLGILFNFQTTGRLVFGSSDPRKIIRFLAVYGILYGVGLLGMRVGESFGYTAYISGAAMMVVNAPLGFVLNRHLVFAES